MMMFTEKAAFFLRNLLPAFHPVLLLTGALLVCIAALLRRVLRFFRPGSWLDSGRRALFFCGIFCCLLSFCTGSGFGFGTGEGTGPGEEEAGPDENAPALTEDAEAAADPEMLLIRIRAEKIYLDGDLQEDCSVLKRSLHESLTDTSTIRLQDDYADNVTWTEVLALLRDLALSYEKETIP